MFSTCCILFYPLFYSNIIPIRMLLRLRRLTNDKQIFKYTVAVQFCRMQFGWFLEVIIIALIVARPIKFILGTSISEGLVPECSWTNLYSKTRLDTKNCITPCGYYPNWENTISILPQVLIIWRTWTLTCHLRYLMFTKFILLIVLAWFTY